MLGLYSNYLRPYRSAFIWGTLLSVSGYGIWLIIPWVMGEIITFAAAYRPGATVAPAWRYLGMIALTALYYYSAVEIGRGVLRWVGERMGMDVQKQMLHTMGLLNLSWHEAQNTGNRLKQVNRAAESLRKLFNLYIDLGIDVCVSLIGIPIVFAFLSWELNLILLLFFGVHYALSVWLTRRALHQSRLVNREEEQLNGMQYEMLNSITTIKSLGMHQQVMGWLEGQMQALLKTIKRRIVLFRTRMGVLGFERQLFRLLIIGVAVWKVIEGEFEVGMIAQVYFYFGKVEVTADRITAIAHQWSLTRVDTESMQQLLAETPSLELGGKVDFPLDWQRISFRKVSFRYGQQQVLHQLSFDIQRGEKIGIIGASGQGKSTLMRLLLKLYEGYEGFIGFDELSLADIRRPTYIPHVGVVLQHTELFNLSIRDNILLAGGDTPPDERRLAQAADIACLSELIASLPQGWDTVVGEKGVKLSGGERQRLGLARAVYRRPQLLLLDEATAHLDAASEAIIQAGLDQLFEQVTAIVIAHRLSTLRKMDRIFLLENGRIAQTGTYETLQQDAHGRVFFS